MKLFKGVLATFILIIMSAVSCPVNATTPEKSEINTIDRNDIFVLKVTEQATFVVSEVTKVNKDFVLRLNLLKSVVENPILLTVIKSKKRNIGETDRTHIFRKARDGLNMSV